MKSENDWRAIGIISTVLIIGVFFVVNNSVRPEEISKNADIEKAIVNNTESSDIAQKIDVQKLTVTHPIGFDDPDLVSNSFLRSKEFMVRPSGKVLGGILPHHYSVAGAVIAGFYEGVSDQQVDTIIVMGPDHFNASSRPIVTSLGNFITSFGTVMPDTDLIFKILASSDVVADEAPFDKEHSIYSQMPFIKKVFPEAKIVPFIINIKATREDADSLAEAIIKNIGPNTLVLASVDFVHYLSSSEAEKLDRESINVFETLEPEEILDLTDQLHLDSQIGVYTLFKIAQGLGADKTQLISNTNSGKLAEPPFTEKVVSYVNMYMIKSDSISK